VHAPAAAEEYARRLAQRGVPASALLRAYRIGSARFQDWCLEELGRSTDNVSIVSAAGLRIADITSAYIDKVSEEMLSAYEAGKENWLRNLSVARAARVQALLRGERVDVDSSEAILGYRLRQHHLGVVCWVADAAPGGSALGALEQATAEIARQAGLDGRPIFLPQDESSAWAWLPLGAREASPSLCAAGAESGIRFALGSARSGVSGHHATLRDTLRVFLQESGSFVAAAERLTLHKNTVRYRIGKAEESLGHPVGEDRSHVELALLAAQWLGPAVLRHVSSARL
jgi:DNA-binding PucR family transcriptional regulator